MESEREIICFGDNSFGQLGIGNTMRANPYDPVSFGVANDDSKSEDETPDAVDIQCGSLFTVLLESQGKLKWCGTFNGIVSPRLSDFYDIPQTYKFLQISCGRKHILGILEGGYVASWGIGFFGQLGHGDDSSWDSPRIIQTLEPQRFPYSVKNIVCGGSHSGLITECGKAFMWGLNHNGQCGSITKSETILEPRPVDFSEYGYIHAINLVCGRNHTLMLSATGKVYSWGATGYGRLGLNEPKKRQQTPIEITALTSLYIHSLAVGDFHNLALSNDGGVYSWGYNAEGQCGQGHIYHIRTPQRILTLDSQPIQRIICGTNWSMAVTSTGNLYGWGYADGGWMGVKPPEDLPFLDQENENSQMLLQQQSCIQACSFESSHNILIPIKIKTLTSYLVYDVRCGAAHTIVIAQKIRQIQLQLQQPVTRSSSYKDKDRGKRRGSGYGGSHSMDASDDEGGIGEQASRRRPFADNSSNESKGRSGGGRAGEDGEDDEEEEENRMDRTGTSSSATAAEAEFKDVMGDGDDDDSDELVDMDTTVSTTTTGHGKGGNGDGGDSVEGGVASHLSQRKPSQSQKAEAKGEEDIRRGVVGNEDRRNNDSSDNDYGNNGGGSSDSKMISDINSMDSHSNPNSPLEPPSSSSPSSNLQYFSWVRHKKIDHLRNHIARGLIGNINMMDGHGNTLLITACQNGHLSIVKLLLDHGAGINLKNYKGNTALHHAFAFQFIDIGNYLISKGADEYATNHEGLTCYEGLSLSDLDAL